jgi:hypothetical protein
MSEPQRNLTADHLEVVDGRERDEIQGWVPDLAREAEREALEKALAIAATLPSPAGTDLARNCLR